MSRIIQLTPCTDWFYLERDQHSSEWSAKPVAAWGLTSEGEMLGMLSIDGILDSAQPPYPHLKPAPESGGKFIHISKLSAEQQIAVSRRPY